MSRWTDKADIFSQAYVQVFKGLPSKHCVLFGLSVAEWETGCGDRLHGNWGGTIQGQLRQSDLDILRAAGLDPSKPADLVKAQSLLIPPAHSLLGRDTSAQSGWYWIWWHLPATPVDGALYFINVLIKQRPSCKAILEDDNATLDALARSMYATHYFLGLFNPHDQAVVYNGKYMTGEEANIESYRDHLFLIEPGIVAGLAGWQPGQPPFDLSSTLGVQLALTYLSFHPGLLDNDDGPLTKAAIEAFQQSVGLPLNGIVGDSTRTAFELAVAERSKIQ
jgi:hypothetical protein